jgi:hypothetical protein
VRRWGAGKGSRWPAMLLLLGAVVLGVAVVWSLAR